MNSHAFTPSLRALFCSVFLVLVAASPQSEPQPKGALAPMSFFVGSWHCSGAFSNGKKTVMTMTFAADLAGASLVQHLDDTLPPALYHAIELWGYSAADKRFNSAVQDSLGGIRDFTSPGWVDGVLVWTSAPSVKPLQEFTYKKYSNDSFSVDWSIARTGLQFTLGDTLACARAGS